MIRLATEKDIDRIFELLEQVLLIHHSIRPDIFKEKGTKYTRDRIMEIIKNENTPVFVCEINDNVVAHAFTQIRVKEEGPCTYPKKTLFIDDLVVDETVRGQGIGGKVYEFLKNYANQYNFDNIVLDVWEGNDNARAFYESLGMRPQQTIMEENLK